MRVSRKAVCFWLLRVVSGSAVVFATMLTAEPDRLVPPIAAIVALSLLAYRLDFTNLWVAFSLPWVVTLGYSAVEISHYSRPISQRTVLTIVSVLAIGFALLPTRGVRPPITAMPVVGVNDRAFKTVLVGFLGFCALNVGLAGYVPLIKLILTGDSGYMDFGVKGLYGLFNAFANAYGLTAFYLWMLHRRSALYRNTYFLVLAVFLLFVTRQNIISLLVESFAVYCMVVRRISGLHIGSIALVTLVAFAGFGDLRVGVGADIADLGAIKEQFLWIPRAFIWLFAYCYFNVLNLDNVVESAAGPAFDGSSFASLLPSFLRPEALGDGTDLLEVSTFTVTSFISPVYHDLGLVGLLVVFAVLCLSTHWYLHQQSRGKYFVGDTGYAVLYFCFMFSFFVNFWFYLPVISQLVFFPLLSRFMLRPGRCDDVRGGLVSKIQPEAPA